MSVSTTVDPAEAVLVTGYYHSRCPQVIATRFVGISNSVPIRPSLRADKSVT